MNHLVERLIKKIGNVNDVKIKKERGKIIVEVTDRISKKLYEELMEIKGIEVKVMPTRVWF